MASLAITQQTLALAKVDPLTAQQINSFPALPSNAAQIINALQAANCPLTQVQRNALTASITGVLNDAPMSIAQFQQLLGDAHVSLLSAAQLAALVAAGFVSTTQLVPLASDNFTRANEQPLNPANWSSVTDKAFPLSVLNNSCAIGVGAPAGGAGENYIGVVSPNDQYASVTVNTFDNATVRQDGLELRLRNDPTGVIYFLIQLLSNGDGTTLVSVADEPNEVHGFFATIGSIISPGDVLLASIMGQTLTVSYNGTQVISVDTTYASINSGQTGLNIRAPSGRALTTASLFVTGAVQQGTLLTIAELQAALTSAGLPLTNGQVWALNA